MEITDGLKVYLKEAVSVLKKVVSGGTFTAAQKNFIADFYEREAEEKATTWIKKQTELASKLGVTTKTIQNHQHEPGAPKKHPRKGYAYEKWRDFLQRGNSADSDFTKYLELIDTDSLRIGSAENHKLLETHTARSAQMFEMAQKLNDMNAALIFKDLWLDFSERLKKFEELTKKHKLEIGEAVEVSVVLDCITIAYVAMSRAFEIGKDQICKLKISISDPAVLKSHVEPLFREAVASEMRGAVVAELIPEQICARVLEIFDVDNLPKKPAVNRASTPAKKKRLPAKKKRTPAKKKRAPAKKKRAAAAQK